MNSVKNSPVIEFDKKNDLGIKIAKIIAFIIVLIGMLNTIPSIPGLEDLIHRITGNDRIVFRKFSYEYFFPIIFFAAAVSCTPGNSTTILFAPCR